METKEKQRRPAAKRPSAAPARSAPTKRTSASPVKAAANNTRSSAGAAKPAAKKSPQQAARTASRQPERTRKQPASATNTKNTQKNRSTQAKRSAATSRKTRVQENVPEVVYLPPKPFSRNRLLLRLATLTSVVLALLLGISVFFKVENFEVSGNVKYDQWTVGEASGVLGGNLLTFSHAKAAGKIQTTLPYVKSVRIGIKLPDTVKIVIEETEVTYAVQAADESWWLVSSVGKVIEKAASGSQESCTKLLGVQIADPVPGQQAAVLETTVPGVDEQGNPIPVTVTDAQRLSTALDIAGFLEQSGIIGQAASIDVTDASGIQLWYGKQYLVKLGDNSQLRYKIGFLKSIIEHGGKYDSGVLDITLTERPNEVIWTLFDE